MKFVRALDGVVEAYPYDLESLRRDNPSTSFPTDPKPDDLTGWNVYPVTPAQKPVASFRENAVEQMPQQIDGAWTQVWDVVQAEPNDAFARFQEQWVTVRAERNGKLAACDWTQLADAPIDSLQWAVYRQILRDITEQTDPFTIIWPVAPI